MRNFLLISVSVISLFMLLGSIPWLRIYVRTGMKGAQLRGVGQIALSIGFWGIFFWLIRDDTLSLPFVLIGIVGIVIFQVGNSIWFTKEHGLWKQIYEKSSIWEIMTGKVAILKYDKLPPPVLNKRTGLIIGIFMMTAGSLISVMFILTSISFLKGLLVFSISAFIVGLLFVIFSIAYLGNEGEKPLE